MVHAFYLTMFILSLGLTVMLMTKFVKRISAYHSLLFAGIVIVNLGYMQLYSSTNLVSAVYANQVTYMSAFIPLIMLLCVADLCKYHLHKLLVLVSFLAAVFVFLCVSTIGGNDLFYRDLTLVIADGYSYLQKDYGPLHTIYPAYILTMLGSALFIIIRSFRHKRMISYITSTMLTIVMGSAALLYCVQRTVGFTLDFMPLAYILIQICIIMLLNRMALYDVSAISGSFMTSSLEFGFVLYTDKGRFTGADIAARTWFPEVDELFLDYSLLRDDTDFFAVLSEWKDEHSAAPVSRLIERNGLIIEAEHRYVTDGLPQPVHFITLRDATEREQYLQLVENFNEELESEVKEKTSQLSKVQDDIILAMASIVENRDNNTGGHIRRTSDIVRIFVDALMMDGRYAELDEKTAERIIKAAPLHDFGKIGIPDIILNKPGKFTPEEYAQMQKHSEKGAVIVSEILRSCDDAEFRAIAVNIAHYHHEKWNGKGYPTGIAREDIPFEARVMALADVFDALVSKRVYKENFSYDKAFSIIEESCGEHFDPDLCSLFLTCRPKLESLYNSYTD